MPPSFRPEGPFQAFRKTANQSLKDSPLRPGEPSPLNPSGPITDPDRYNAFLREENAARKRRWKRTSRQTLAWVLICSLLPLLILALGYFMK